MKEETSGRSHGLYRLMEDAEQALKKEGRERDLPAEETKHI